MLVSVLDYAYQHFGIENVTHLQCPINQMVVLMFKINSIKEQIL
jgi:hypothetical protein